VGADYKHRGLGGDCPNRFGGGCTQRDVWNVPKMDGYCTKRGVRPVSTEVERTVYTGALRTEQDVGVWNVPNVCVGTVETGGRELYRPGCSDCKYRGWELYHR
jgi:hypothetical protein